MTAKEAIEILNDGATDWKEIISVLVIAKKALGKMIPQKPIELKGMNHRGVCPACKNIQDIRCSYCPDCGQTLDWKGKGR